MENLLKVLSQDGNMSHRNAAVHQNHQINKSSFMFRQSSRIVINYDYSIDLKSSIAIANT